MPVHNIFSFKLAGEKLQKYQRQSRAMHIMASLCLIIYTLPYAANFKEDWIMLLGVLLPSITILIVAIFKNVLITDVHNNRIFRVLEAGFLFMGCMHYLQINKNMPALLFGIIAAFILFLLWMESRILQEQYIVFDESGIEVELPLSTKKYAWAVVEDVIMKNNYITINLASNKFLQIKIQSLANESDLEDFLFFCNNRLVKNA